MRQPVLGRIIVPQPLPTPFPDVAAEQQDRRAGVCQAEEAGHPALGACAATRYFLRRVYLDVIGTLPTPEEARAFLADKDPQKRSKLIDRLLEREEFADFWALKWGDLLRIKSEYPVNLWPKAVQAYYRWVRESIAQNKPYDQFARELLTANGSNFRDGPCNFYPGRHRTRTRRPSPRPRPWCSWACGWAAPAATPIPTENWTLDDNLGMAAFFAKVAIKPTNEWKEEIVYFNPDGGAPASERSGELVKPKLLGGDACWICPAEEDPRDKFADWLTAPENPWFARNIVNRIWFWLLGRGIVHEPDDLRPTNPPENPRAAGVPGPGAGRPQVRPEAHLPADPQLADLPALQQAQRAERERRGPFLPLPRSGGWAPSSSWTRSAR